MDDEIDYTKHTEPELVDMFGRLDPRYAPPESARLAKISTGRGYTATEGTTGPGSATPGSDKLRALIGSTSPFECNVDDVRGTPMSLWLAGATAAAGLVRILPKRRTKDFHPRLEV